MLVNKLNWVSSLTAPPEVLDRLNDRMSRFYSSFEERPDYQKLNDDLHDVASHPNNKLAEQVALDILSRQFKDVLEVGCGSGRIYRHLQEHGFQGSYTGVEMAEYVIEGNRTRYPGAQWKAGSVYDLEQWSDTYDCCFCFYVLEHLIYPERGLSAMMGRVRKGGSLVLLFPDASSSGIVPSQKIGLQYGPGAKEKLKHGKMLDALISLVEAGMMRRRLKHINDHYGDFVINTTPYCLDKECKGMTPDFDAIYLGSKEEIERWARKKGYSVSFPLGKEGLMSRNAYVVVSKDQ